MQTRSMTRRAGQPHDLVAFNSYADFEPILPRRQVRRQLTWDEDSDDSSFVPSDDEIDWDSVGSISDSSDDEVQVVPELHPADDYHEDMARQVYEEMMSAQRLRGARRRVSFAWCKQ